MKAKNRRGVLTVEAAIILPIFIMVMVFILNMLSLFYFHLVMQQALLNAGRTLAQYGYVIDEVMDLMGGDLELLALQEETSNTETELATLINNVKDSGNNLVQSMGEVQNFLDNLPVIMSSGQEFSNSLTALVKKLDELSEDDGTGKMIVNYLLASAMNVAGGKFVEWMVGDYLTNMQAKTDTLNEIKYGLYVEAGTKDIILVAYYDYELPFDFFPVLHLQQLVRVHPWIGGETEGAF